MTRSTRLNVPIKSCAINQYISHVIDHLCQRCCLPAPSHARSYQLRLLLAGYAKHDDVDIPHRLLDSIPVTYAIANVMFDLIPQVFPNPVLQCAMRAALSLAYGLSLRPMEYLDDGSGVDLDHQTNTTLCFFLFGDVWVCICDSHLYPEGVLPSAFVCIYDKLKNTLRGGVPRSVVAHPHPSRGGFCVVQTLFAYFTRFPPSRECRALASHGPCVRWDDFRLLCHVTAVHLGLDPARLLPKSARCGVLAQIDSLPTHVKCRQGGWTSEAGMAAYLRASLSHAHVVGPSMYDIAACPLSHTVLFHTDHRTARAPV